METIIGFAVGYIAGAQEGKAGLNRIRTSLRAIAESPQTRRIATDAITLAGSIAGRRSARGAMATANGLAGLVIRRLTESSSRGSSR
jgi:hypothetical protein